MHQCKVHPSSVCFAATFSREREKDADCKPLCGLQEKELIPVPSACPRLPPSTPRDGKRDERLWGDCREGEAGRRKPLGQAHGVEKGGPTLPLPTRGTMPETPVPGGGYRLTNQIPEAASASGPVTLFDIPGGFRARPVHQCTQKPAWIAFSP